MHRCFTTMILCLFQVAAQKAPPDAFIAGIALRKDGTAIPQATVTAYRWKHDEIPHIDAAISSVLSLDSGLVSAGVVTAGEDGKFRISIEPWHAYVIQAKAPGCASRVYFPVPPGGLREADLLPLGEISGGCLLRRE